MRYMSPLRYPGGKVRLAPYFAQIIAAQTPVPTHYAEPYAGGAGAALRLLSEGVVDQIHINDINKGIAAFWRTITTPDGAREFARLIACTPVTVDQWHHQHEIYKAKTGDDPTLGSPLSFLTAPTAQASSMRGLSAASTRPESGASIRASTSPR